MMFEWGRSRPGFVVPLLMTVAVVLTACAPNPAERVNAGNGLLNRGEPAQALEAYQLAQVLEPDSPEAYYNAGIAYERLDQLQTARAALDQALRTADENLIQAAYYNLGNVYFQLEQYREAVDVYREVLLRNPDDQQARYNMELALMYVLDPTPTAQEQRTEPEEDQTDPETTPTDQPNAPDAPTPTPPRDDSTPDPSATPAGGSGDFASDEESTLVPQVGGELSVEEAQRILDLIEQDQQSLSEFLKDLTEAGEPLENDW